MGGCKSKPTAEEPEPTGTLELEDAKPWQLDGGGTKEQPPVVEPADIATTMNPKTERRGSAGRVRSVSGEGEPVASRQGQRLRASRGSGFWKSIDEEETPEEIQELVDLIWSGDPDEREDGTRKLLNVSVDDEFQQRAIAKSGAIKTFVAMMYRKPDEATMVSRPSFERTRSNVVGIVANIASLDDDMTKRVLVASGALEPLVKILKDDTPRAQEWAGAAIQNLAVCTDLRPKILAAGAVPPLVNLVKNGVDGNYGSVEKPGVKRKAAGALRNLAQGDEIKRAIVTAGAIPALLQLRKTGSPGAKEHAEAALKNLDADTFANQALSAVATCACAT